MFLRQVIISILCIAIHQQGYAQHYIFNRISISDGLLSNNVRTVWQDNAGYLWIGTEGGLQRYDGIRFRTILNDPVEQIVCDTAGRVWIRSGKQVGIFDTQTFLFTTVVYEGSEDVHNSSGIWLRKDASGNVFLQLTEKNCQYFNTARGNFSSSYNPFTIPGHVKVLDVKEDLDKGRYWILSSEGLAYWDKKTKTYYTTSNNTQNDPLLSLRKTGSVISDFFIGNKHTYWLQENHNTAAHFRSYNSSLNTFTEEAASLNVSENNSYFEIYDLKNINDSTIAVYGLNYFRIQNGQYFYNLKTPINNNPYGIQFNSVSDVLQDKEGIIWVATDNGLYYTSNILRNIHFFFSQEQSRGAVSSLLQDHDNNLWIATWGRGLFRQPGNFADSIAAPVNAINDLDDFSKMAWTLCEDSRGNLWVGCDEGRLIKYNLQSKKAVLYKPSVFQHSAVRQMVKDNKGILWIGLQNGKIFTLNPADKHITDHSPREICTLNGATTKMVLINNKHIWVAIDGKGIYVIDTDSSKVIQSIDKHKINSSFIANIKDILQANDTLCFVAGEKLASINTKTFKIYTNLPYNTIPAGTIYTLQKDRDNHYWLGGSAGIFKLNVQTNVITRYTQQDGLITIHNNSYVPERSTVLHSGEMAFGGNQHMVIFDPGDYNISVPPPNVNITGFQLNDRYLPQDSLDGAEEISIPHEYKAFTIGFAAPSFRQRGKLVYEYKLDGMDKQWIAQTNNAPIKYNFLPHGKYRFLIRAKNDLGQYSPGITSLNLYIIPPFWKTIWFYILITLATASLLFYLHRLRLQKLLHIERVRSRLARDLHDDMGSTLSTINILSNMALQQKSFDETKSKEYMSTINSSTSQMMEAMDDIVWSINPANDNLAKIITRMKETAGAILEPRQIEYHFEVPPAVPELRLSMETRREIFLIFKEALNNIIKYADCTEVVFTFTKKGNSFILIINDNGKGFQTPVSESAVRGNGLKNMEKRAANINGLLSVKSETGKGTTIQLSVPIA